MGQYFIIANPAKQEYIDPSKMGSGAKLWEVAANYGAMNALTILLSQSTGGGDINGPDNEIVGRWVGDPVVLVGDYDSSHIYDTAKSSWKDITKPLVDAFNRFIGSKRVRYTDYDTEECE